jgi:SNF2 family DNA or RNA helicase
LLSRSAAYLAMEMRLGKTLPVIRWLRLRRCERVLVIAPYSALYGWARELEAEGAVPEDYIFVTGDREQRLSALREFGPGWYLMNKEGYRVVGEEAARVPWDAIVLDEATWAKNPQSDTVRWLRKLPRLAGQTRVCLSGTPAPEGPQEWFEQLHFLDPAWLGFRDYWAWRAAMWTRPIGETDGHQWFLTTRGREHLEAALARNVFTMSRADAGLGPEKVYRIRTVQLPPEIRKRYETVEREFVLEAAGAQEIASTVLACVAFIWMRRLAGGAGIETDFPQDGLVHDAKITALLELLNGELHGQQVIVWASLLTEIRRIEQMLPDQCVVVHGGVTPAKRDAAAQAFQRGGVRCFVAQPECFRHGVDLGAATAMVYYSSPLGLETRLQTEDRFVDLRKRQDGLLIIDLLTEGTVDGDIYAALRAKRKRAEVARAVVRGIQERASAHR